jgi:hypothetical protein
MHSHACCGLPGLWRSLKLFRVMKDRAPFPLAYLIGAAILFVLLIALGTQFLFWLLK